MSGHIYCFNTHENPNIIKAGHTQQDVQKRLRGYLGPTKPRCVIFTLQVGDSVEAEKMMLNLMKQCVSLKQRHDLGNEWFEMTGNFKFEQRADHLQMIAKIVQKASSVPSVPARPHTRISKTNRSESEAEPPVQQATALRGLEDYFKRFDDFVAQETAAQNNVSPLALLRIYEASTFCPYGNLCEFLPFSENERVKVTARRYREFLP